MPTELRTFVGGQNSDDDVRLIPEGDYIVAKNIINIENKNKKGVVRKIKGTKQITNSLPLGVNRCLNAYDHKEAGCVYFFNWNSEGFHGIYSYNYRLGTVEPLLLGVYVNPDLVSDLDIEEDAFNFKINRLIKNIDLIDNTIYWSGDDNEPRHLNLGNRFYMSKPISLFVDENEISASSGNSITFKNTLPIEPSIIPYYKRLIGQKFDIVCTYNTESATETIEAKGNLIAYTYGNTGMFYTFQITSGNAAIITSNDAELVSATTQSKFLRKGRFLDLAKPPIEYPPTAQYTTNPTKKYNKLKTTLWQFRVRYVYEDYNRSDFGEPSKVVVPPYSPTLNDYNEIVLSFNSGDKDVRLCEVYVRNGATDRSMRDWQLADKIDVMENEFNTISYSFSNDVVLTAADQAEANEAYSYVPIRANAQTAVENRLTWFNVEQDYDLPKGVSLNAFMLYSNLPSQEEETPVTVSLGSTITSSQLDNKTLYYPAGITRIPLGLRLVDNVSSGYNSPNAKMAFFGDTYFYNQLIVSGDLSKGRALKFNLNISSNYPSKGVKVIPIYVYAGESDLTNAEVKSSIRQQINSSINRIYTNPIFGYLGIGGSQGMNTVSGIVVEGDMLIKHGRHIDSTSNAGGTYLILSISVTDVANEIIDIEYFVEKSIARQNNKKVGIEYEDGKGRRSTVAATTDVYVKGYGEMPSVINEENNQHDIGATSLVVNIPFFAPSWAKRWRPVVSEDNGYQYSIYVLGVLEAGGSFNEYKFKMIELLGSNPTNTFNGKRQASILNYSFVRGDRIRLVFKEVDIPNLIMAKDYFKTSQNLDFEVDRYVVADRDLFFTSSTSLAIGSGEYYLMQVYRPSKGMPTDVTRYRTIGETYPIIYDDVNEVYLHGGLEQDQTFTNDGAYVKLNYGDCYFRNRVYFKNGSSREIWIEDFNASDFFESAVTGWGRPNIYDESYKKATYQTRAYYTQPYIQNTNINGLSTVFGLNTDDYDNIYGGIKRAYYEDRSIIVCQEDKIGRIPIFEEVIREGANITLNTSKFLNKIQYYQLDYGISSGEMSFVENSGRKYFSDEKRMGVLRLSGNGLTPISDYKQTSVYNEVFSQTIGRESRPLILGVYSKIYEAYILNVQDKVVWDIEGFTYNPNSGLATISIKNNIDYIKIGDLVNIIYSYRDVPPFVFEVGNGDGGVGGGDEEVGGVIVVEENYYPAVSENVVISAKSGNVITFSISAPINTELSNIFSISALLNSHTNVFHESDNRWKFTMNINPEIMVSSGVGVVAFIDGQIHEMFQGDLLKMFGADVEAKITIPFNQMPTQPKKPLTMQQDSVESWEVSEVRTVEGGLSRIPKNRFKKRQYQNYGEFLRDTKTPIGNALLRGRDILTVAMEVDIANDSKEDTALLAVGVNYVPQNLANNQ